MRAPGRYRSFGARIQALAGLIWAIALATACTPAARAAVALLLEDPYGHMGKMNPTGHSAIYLDHVCAATPLSLRACRPGELGVVISRYDGIGNHDWVAIPLIPYLYAVDDPADIPATVRQADVDRLRDAYRRKYLADVAPDTPGGRPPEGNWYELAGSAYDRSIYGFRVRSTPEQDAELIALFNDRRNVELYNGMFRNCADFARVTLNRFYPHAVRRNFIADLGMTTPKSTARALTHYADKHPEAGLQVFRVAQISGDVSRSHNVQDVAESLLKEYGIPLIVFSPATVGALLVAYIGHGRFAEPKNAPVLNLRVGLSMPNSVTLESLAYSDPSPADEVSAYTAALSGDSGITIRFPALSGDAGETPPGVGSSNRSENGFEHESLEMFAGVARKAAPR